MPASGGEAVQVTRNHGTLVDVSADGKWLYYSYGWPLPESVFRVPVEGGEETKVLDSVALIWTLGKEGIYFATGPDEQGHGSICLHEFTTGKTRKLATIQRPVSLDMDVSPDGRTLLYSQSDDIGSDLMLVENFR
jgi:Tol biopolymer transport system component